MSIHRYAAIVNPDPDPASAATPEAAAEAAAAAAAAAAAEPPAIRIYEYPAHWRHDPHNQAERAARQGARKREELRPRDIECERLLRERSLQLAAGVPLAARWTYKKIAARVQEIGRELGEVWKVNKKVIEGALDRLRRGNRRPTCGERKCGREPGAPCHGRPWTPFLRWINMTPVARYRETVRQRARFGARESAPAPSLGEGGIADLVSDRLPITLTQREGEGWTRRRRCTLRRCPLTAPTAATF